MTKKKQEIKEVEKQEVKQDLEDEIKFGYAVALRKDGNFHFQLLGKEKGLVELLGLHLYADKKLSSMLDMTHGSGDFLVREVGGMVSKVASRVEQIAQKVLGSENQIKEID